MSKCYLAVDIGASSGRLIMGAVRDGVLEIKELYRFKNGMDELNGHKVWDHDRLFNEIVNGLKKVKPAGLEPVSLAIDTWGCDYVLIDGEGRLCDVTYAYRDDRTAGVPDRFYAEVMPLNELYARNGIQKMDFNTVYQLYAHKLQNPAAFERAEHFLQVPDYLNYRLTGEVHNEYTNATTCQLVNAAAKEWDYELLEKMGIPARLFQPLELPGSSAGMLKPEIVSAVGFNCEVVMTASHDTAAAVAATPLLADDHIYLSSGTWSLMGIERAEADTSDLSCQHNFTNEGGVNYRYRYLKNIMGLWILQNIRKELPDLSFSDSNAKAGKGSGSQTNGNVNEKAVLAPESMLEAFRSYCRDHQLPVPQSVDEIIFCAYNSLSDCYRSIIAEIEAVTGRTFAAVNVIGGGCQDQLLNYLLKKASGKQVLAGPIEATAIGNLTVQMIKSGAIADLHSARELIAQSFAVNEVSLDAFNL